MLNRVILLIFLLINTVVNASQNKYNIIDFGAISDGKTLNTAAINKAIKACHDHGGGMVYVPPGTFISGPIQLLNRVNLHLELGAHIKGSSTLSDYMIDGQIKGLIYAFEQQNIALTGLGKIDGNSDVFFDFTKKHNYVGFDRKMTRQGESNLPENVTFFKDGPVFYKERPDMMVVLLRCEQVNIKDLTFINSPNWSFRIGDSDGIHIDNINIFNNLLVPNSDGIHCTTSRNIIISNCEISAGDDAIAITGFGDETGVRGRMNDLIPDYSTRTVGNKVGKVENVVVSNCVLHSRSAGVRIGYGDNDIQNCTFQNLVIHDANRGIGIFNRDRANIENITFNNIIISTKLYTGCWWGKGEPIHISSMSQDASIPVGHIKNINFSNVQATSEAGILVYGTEESILENINFKNMEVNIKSSPLSESWGGNFDLRPTHIISQQQFKHDIPGIFVKHVNGLSIDDVKVKWTNDPASFYTHGLEVVKCQDGKILNFSGSAAQEGYKPIEVKDCTNVEF